MVAGALLWFAFAGPALQVPWTCGVTKPCTQAHNGFSHNGTSEFAWDFDVNEGEEVWAASAGTVSYIRMDSTTGGCDESYGNDANYVVVDHDDGTAIVYMHLQPNSSPLQVGDAVVPGMLIARVGLTGYVCGDHLHLQVMEQCGSPYCQSLPASFVDYGDPAQGDSIESTNCPSCGLVLDGGETLISELEPGCFVRETTAWWSAFSGDDDHHFYTMATDADADASIGRWRFGVATPGDYRVEVFVPDADADASGAVYRVFHDGAVDSVPVDQASAKGWQTLGVFGFTGADDEHVELGDATGEAAALQRRLAYDAVRFTFVPSASDDGGSSGAGEGTGTATGSGGADTGGGGGSADAGSEGGLASDSGTSAAAGDDDALPDTFGGASDGPAGCGCSTPATTGAPWLLPSLLGWARRRRGRVRAVTRRC
ncbi:MAG: peptidoglycan DD-metalloendopeptidase family protein [Nannocystaceae bacterium]|nr:peptidoglycan DD-metalloendopeptidase family protein [Nannocystaceae bacterium]